MNITIFSTILRLILLNHSEHLKEQASLLSSMLKSMEIDKILVLCETEPDFFTIFGETEDNIHDWRLSTEIRIKDLLIKANQGRGEEGSYTVWLQEALLSQFQW